MATRRHRSVDWDNEDKARLWFSRQLERLDALLTDALVEFSDGLRPPVDEIPQEIADTLAALSMGKFADLLSEQLDVALIRTPPVIACVESLWTDNVERKLSVAPMLEMLRRLFDVRIMHFPCNTREEVRHNLKKVREYGGQQGMLYVAMHGDQGRVATDEGVLDLAKLTVLIDDQLEDWSVHFGSCETVGIPKKKLEKFLDASRLACVSGFKERVDWAEGTALDFLLFSYLLKGQHIPYGGGDGPMEQFAEQYSSLVESTGFVWSARSYKLDFDEESYIHFDDE